MKPELSGLPPNKWLSNFDIDKILKMYKLDVPYFDFVETQTHDFNVCSYGYY